MSSEIAIDVDNIQKCFHIYGEPRDRLLQMLSRGKRQYFREFWALKGVSFSVRRGETVGIVGRNGSGKSTLLQIVCGTLTPTAGSVRTSGRVAALLELGSGFNPEFSGRENVFLNAAILGLSHDEIVDRFAEIERFSDIGTFMDQPVKTYSSGMMVRLAFSVAINVEPSILIVDEALAVGDELFQRKCFAKIESLKKSGTTILFVSHAGSTIVELCDRAVLIDGGEKMLEGSPKFVIAQYQKLLYAPLGEVAAIRDDMKETRQPVGAEARASASTCSSLLPEEFYDPHLVSKSVVSYGQGGAVISNPAILREDGRQVNNLRKGDTYKYTYEVSFQRDVERVRFGMMIKSLSGVEIGGGATLRSDSVPTVRAGEVVLVAFRFCCRLNPGMYFLNAGTLCEENGEEIFLHRLLDAAPFRVMADVNRVSTGFVDFQCKLSIDFASKGMGSNE